MIKRAKSPPGSLRRNNRRDSARLNCLECSASGYTRPSHGFETIVVHELAKQFEETIAEESFTGLKQGVINFISENHFKRFVMIIRSAGFVDASLIGGQNPLNFAYILYLRGRKDEIPAADPESLVRRWFVMAVLTQRYSGNPETAFDLDIRQVGQRGMANHVNAVVEAELSTGFWNTLLPQEMETSSATSPYFRIFQAAQVKLCDPGFLSKDIKVTDLILNRCDVHHLFPKEYLKEAKIPRGRYNQIANFADKIKKLAKQLNIIQYCNGFCRFAASACEINRGFDSLHPLQVVHNKELIMR